MTEQCSFRGGDGLHLCFPEVRIKDMTVVRLCLYFWTICVNSPKSIVLFNFFCNFATKSLRYCHSEEKTNEFVLFFARFFVSLHPTIGSPLGD